MSSAPPSHPLVKLNHDVLDDAQPIIKMVHGSDSVLTFSSPSRRQLQLPSNQLEITNHLQDFSQDVSPVNSSASFALHGAVEPQGAHPTFSSTTDLARHYGIPQFLPPVPRTTPHNPPPQPPLPDFLSLRSNYLSMLSNTPGDNSSSHTEMPAEYNTSPSHSNIALISANVDEYLKAPDSSSFSNGADVGTAGYTASPEFRDVHSFDVNQFLTSPPPLETPYDTSYDDFGSPNDSPYNDFLTTPLIQDDSDPAIFDGAGDVGALFPEMTLQEPIQAADTKQEAIPGLPDMDKLYTISPSTPFLDSVDPSSLTSTTTMPHTMRRRSVATGTRKNITPESLIPLDAPTQSRKYALPSATSRKEVPAVFARKRPRAEAFDGEEDELEPQEALAPTATEKEKIEWKRRQNTLAARKSRKRKLEYQMYLEKRVETLEHDVKVWKTRAITYEGTLRKNGIPVADFSSDA